MDKPKIVWSSLDPETLSQRIQDAKDRAAEEKKDREDRLHRRFVNLWRGRPEQVTIHKVKEWTGTTKYTAMLLRDMRLNKVKKIDRPWEQATKKPKKED